VLLVAALPGPSTSIQGMAANAQARHTPAQAVTAAPVRAETWEAPLTAVGTLVAVQASRSPRVAGKVTAIAFEAGSRVTAARSWCARTSRPRSPSCAVRGLGRAGPHHPGPNAALLARKTISPSENDTARAQSQETAGHARQPAATSPRRPSAPLRRLSRAHVNLVHVLALAPPSDPMPLDPLYVDFTLPQQHLAAIRPGHPLRHATYSPPVPGSVPGPIAL
jgi:membrane fusion protein (multidrug efflux system)